MAISVAAARRTRIGGATTMVDEPREGPDYPDGMSLVEISNRNICRVCNGNISIMLRRGTGLCCENCEKKENGQ